MRCFRGSAAADRVPRSAALNPRAVAWRETSGEYRLERAARSAILVAVRYAYHVYSAPAPLGLLFLAATDRGLRHVEYLEKRSIKRVIAGHSAGGPPSEWTASLLALKDVADQLTAYLNGHLKHFDLPLDPVGEILQRATWRAIGGIPYAETRTAGDLAKTIGQPRGARTVALAVHANPLVLVVPCHRALGEGGSLTGYRGGVTRHRWLIEHEARFGRAMVRPGEITEVIPEARRKAEPARAVAAARNVPTSRPAAARVTARVAPAKKPSPPVRKRGRAKAPALASGKSTAKTPGRRRT